MNPSLLSELKRRRVFRALVGYGIAAFAVLQIIEPVMHGLHWPEEVLSWVVVALAIGFPLVVSLAWIFDVNAGRIERTPPARLIGVRLGLLLVGIGLVAAAPEVVWYFALRPGARTPPRNDALRATLEAVPPASDIRPLPSIAVLPFADMSAGKDQEYFSDGIAEEILNALAQVEGLQVTDRTSSFSFKGKNEDLRNIGQKLGVAAVLEGSVRKAGNRVRVTAQVVKVADGSHLWSQTYDRDLSDIFAVQDEIAKAVVEALKLRLLSGAAPSPRIYPARSRDVSPLPVCALTLPAGHGRERRPSPRDPRKGRCAGTLLRAGVGAHGPTARQQHAPCPPRRSRAEDTPGAGRSREGNPAGTGLRRRLFRAGIRPGVALMGLERGAR